MLYLAEFNVIKPDWGLIFWTSIIFIMFWAIIGRLAFKPIANALRNRENDIKSALESAEDARKEMMKLKAENEQILAEAREERSKILKEARDTKNRIVQDAREKAKEEASQIVASAKVEIENQKQHALDEVKKEVGLMAITIAENILKKELEGDKHGNYIDRSIDDIQLN